MKFSENWLREWVSPDIEQQQLIEKLTMAGLEVDSAKPAAAAFTQVFVGEILSAKQHPNADRLQVCEVSIGDAVALQIVCGAKNARVGIRVAVAVVGAKLSADFKIRRAKLRGVESSGMICSAEELGLAEKSDGILELAADAPLGEAFWNYYDLNDTIIDIDLTPNRGDCLSIAGIAREVAAQTGAHINAVKVSEGSVQHTDTLAIDISAVQDCPRYAGRIIRQVNANAQTPIWLQERLRRSGLRSISPIVDVTNYVMLELGQPLHAFDMDKLTQGIEVRRAHDGETITLLDEQKLALSADDLVIADQSGPLALAGIMGGLNSAVDGATQHIFLESAYFLPHLIAVRARHYGIQSDSSFRFERGIDFNLQVKALERATELLLAIVGGEVGPITEKVASAHLPQQHEILLRRQRIRRVLGFEVADEKVSSSLQHLGMKLTEVNSGWRVLSPSFRPDISLEEDLIEEIARCVGYEHIPSSYCHADLTTKLKTETQVSSRVLADFLASRAYHEAITYSFVDPKLQSLFDHSADELKLLNPISSDLSVMRSTLWPGLVQAYHHNLHRQQSRLRLFEIGLRFTKEGASLQQEAVLAGLASGTSLPEQWGLENNVVDFYDVKADLEALLEITGASHEFYFDTGTHFALHPAKTAIIYRNGTIVGYIGEINPQISQQLRLGAAIILFELSLAGITQGKLPHFEGLSKFPAIRRDIAILVDKSISLRQIHEKVLEYAGDLLKNVQLFDIYTGEGVDEGQRSLALALMLQHQQRTLVDAEVTEYTDRIVAMLEAEFNATLRK